MRCDRCGREAVHVQRYSGLRLCAEHLAASLDARARGLIRARGWVRHGDRIAVGLSGGPSSSALLRFLVGTFGERRDLSLIAITADEGPGSGMDLDRIRGIAGGMGIGWAVAPLPEEGRDHDEDSREGSPSLRTLPRDRALSSLASEVGATKLALATSLDDEARSVFLAVIRGDASRLLRPGAGGPGGIPLIRPFSRIPEEEILLSARLNGVPFIPWGELPAPGSLEGEADRMLREYTRRHPSALFSLANLGEATRRLSGRLVVEQTGISRFATRTGEAGFRRSPGGGDSP